MEQILKNSFSITEIEKHPEIIIDNLKERNPISIVIVRQGDHVDISEQTMPPISVKLCHPYQSNYATHIGSNYATHIGLNYATISMITIANFARY